MTLLVPLDGVARSPVRPAFVSPVSDPATFTSKVVKAIVKARRITVVCGAGISVQAGIPDFRSSDGLFQSIKKENPKENLSSGKDLFDASVFSAEHTTTLFCQMIARLSRLSLNATPTPFHNVLRNLDERKKLLRVYTQNIDALEEKAGLSFGLPTYGTRGKGKAKVGKGTKTTDGTSTACAASSSSDDIFEPVQPVDGEATSFSTSNETPRCIPLHGTLQLMHCVSCNHPYALSDHSTSLCEGTLPDCPDCTNLEATRSMIGKRLRGIGKLRPSVVLYNEEHSNGEGVGEAVRRDLLGRGGADLLIVVGTSLRVPGTKRIVREFSKAVRAKEKAKAERAHEIALSKLSLPTPSSSPSSSPSPSPGPSPMRDSDSSKTPSPPPLPDLQPEERPISSIYVNLDFPVPTREWDNVFDVWIQGDAQVFAELVKEEIEREEREKVEKLEREERSREERREREEKRRREKEDKERMKQEMESEGSASKVSKGTKKTGKKGLTPTEGKIEKKKRIVVKVNSLSPRLPSTPKSLVRRTVSSGRTSERSLSGRTITLSSQTYRPPSPSKSRLSILSSLASQSPHVFRRRSAPEVVLPASSSVTRNSPSKYGDHNGKGKSKENSADSRLDLLADAAATLSLSHLPSSRVDYPVYAAHEYGTPYRRGEPSTPRRSLSTSGGPGRNRHSAAQHPYQQPSPPDSRAHSHTRTWREFKSPKDEDHDYCASDSPLLSVSTLTSDPSPLTLTSLPRTRKPRITSLELDRSPFEMQIPIAPSVSQGSNYRSTSGNLLDPPINDEHNNTRKSDESSTPTKRKTDSVCTSPKAPSRVKKVKLNITRRSDAITQSDVKWSRNYQDSETRRSISPKSSRDRCSHNSTETHISDSETDAPLHYVLRSPRQEVLCN